MKKFLIAVILLVSILPMIVMADSESLIVTIPEFDVNINGVVIDTAHSQYPVITYKNITYFPMTSDYLAGIGLDLNFNGTEGLKINVKDEIGKLEQNFLGESNVLGSSQTAQVAPFPIMVNGKVIDNNQEEYPVLLFKDITYFPMTWKFAVTEFGWQTSWDDVSGFAIIINKTTTDNNSTSKEDDGNTEQPEYEFNPIDVTMLSDVNRPVVTIEFVDGKKIILKLIPEIAPNTVNNYLTLVQSGYYDGVIFHRIIKDFMIQGGDPDGTGRGGPGYTIKDEFYIKDGLSINYLSHSRGVISMAKTSAPDSAGSQFFIMHHDGTFLDGNYSSFGYVVEGLDVVDELAAVVVVNDKPVEDVVIKTITVELNGYQVLSPEKNN